MVHMITSRMSNIDISVISKFTKWFFWLGLALTVLGIAAISAATLTTVITVTVLGLFITLGSVFLILDTLKFWWGNWGGFFLHLIVAILYLIAGLMLIEYPLIGSMSITFILGVAYVVIGMFRLIYVFNTRLHGSSVAFFNGLISLLIGILILQSWPDSSLFILGLFVGIDLLFVGLAYIFMSLSVKRVTQSRQ